MQLYWMFIDSQTPATVTIISIRMMIVDTDREKDASGSSWSPDRGTQVHRKFSSLLLAAVFAVASLAASATAHTLQPDDLLGNQIYNRFVPEAPAPATVAGVSSVSRTTGGDVSKWRVKAEFSAENSDWQLVSYSLAYQTTQNAMGVKEAGDPALPTNPQAPTGGGNIGDTNSSTLQIGNWRYTFNYTYGDRDGVLGWQLMSLAAFHGLRE